MTQIEKQVAARFQTSDGKQVDILYVTSDEQIGVSIVEATKHAKTLADKSIRTYYRDPAVRAMAQEDNRLQRVINATDICKQFLAMKGPPPTYEEYLALAEGRVISKDIFEFVRRNVYRTRRPMHTGELDQIYVWGKGIVSALFIRRYPQGQVFMFNDRLVLTCPTNTELLGGSFYMIFHPLLGDEPK